MMVLGQVVPYSGSKAVKITESMKKDLDTYNQRRHEITDFDDQISEANVLRDEKNAEIASMQEQANSEDKKEAKEANKRIKGIEKEIDKIDANIKGLEDKKAKLTEKQEKGKLDGVQMLALVAEEPQNETVTDIPETVVENPEINMETPLEQVTEEVPVETDDLSAELDEDFPINSEDTNVVEPEVNPTEETNQEPVEEYKESNEFIPMETVNPETISNSMLTEEDAEDIWEGLKNVELNDDSLVSNNASDEVVPDYSTIPVVPMYDEVVENKEPEVSEEEIRNEVHQDIEQSIPQATLVEPVVTENVMNEVYGEVGVTPEEPVKSEVRDLHDLTLFKDYEDYVFAFGQQHYEKEALTPSEIDALENVKDFLSEKSFNTKRTTQYGKIADENKRLKKKVVTLGKEFTKKVDNISTDYNTSIEDLTKTTDAAKEQAEADRVEKIQTQKLNDSLTDTIKEQTENIETLTNKNNDLQTTIDEQNNRIAELEKENQEQAEKIRMFEEKLNTVFGIVKEVSAD